MPHYFFATRCNSEDFVRDEAGLELDNIEAARDEADSRPRGSGERHVAGSNPPRARHDATARPANLKGGSTPSLSAGGASVADVEEHSAGLERC